MDSTLKTSFSGFKAKAIKSASYLLALRQESYWFCISKSGSIKGVIISSAPLLVTVFHTEIFSGIGSGFADRLVFRTARSISLGITSGLTLFVKEATSQSFAAYSVIAQLLLL